MDNVSKATELEDTDDTNDPLELDADYNLYFRTTLGENPDLRLDYFEDAAAARPAASDRGRARDRDRLPCPETTLGTNR